MFLSELDDPAPTGAIDTPETPTPDFALVGIIGAHLAQPVNAMTKLLAAVEAAGSITGTQVQALERAVQLTRKISRQSQQLARVASRRLRQSHEKLRLHAVVASVLAGRLKEFRTHGIALRHKMQEVDVIVDPGLLIGLIDAALDWACERGQQLNVVLSVKHWPQHAQLVITSSEHVLLAQERPDGEGPDSISWHLLLQLAQTMGVRLDRSVTPGRCVVSLEFPRTVQNLQGLTAVEIDAGGNGSSFSESRPLAGHRVLLISDDDRLRLQVKEICGQLGLTLDRSVSTTLAVRHCEAEIPHLIVIDEHLRDAQFKQLLADLARSSHTVPVVEIAAAPNIVEISSWMDSSSSRLSRGDLDAQLSGILVMELAKVLA